MNQVGLWVRTVKNKAYGAVSVGWMAVQDVCRAQAGVPVLVICLGTYAQPNAAGKAPTPMAATDLKGRGVNAPVRADVWASDEVGPVLVLEARLFQQRQAQVIRHAVSRHHHRLRAGHQQAWLEARQGPRHARTILEGSSYAEGHQVQGKVQLAALNAASQISTDQ